jgi:hypothetical protein
MVQHTPRIDYVERCVFEGKSFGVGYLDHPGQPLVAEPTKAERGGSLREVYARDDRAGPCPPH